jgi:DNA repair protein RecO
MTHIIHEAKGVILDTSEFGESGKVVKVLTPQYGILSLFATGVREVKSKMRGNLLPGTFGVFEFVEGREVRRLTGVRSHRSLTGIFESRQSRNVYNNMVTFLKRIMPSKAEHEELYEKIVESLEILNTIKDHEYFSIPLADVEILEIIMIINILAELGYWKEGEYSRYDLDTFERVKSNKQLLVKEIESAIKSTHL